MGYQSLYANGTYQDTAHNIALGYRAGYAGLGEGNVCIGYQAGDSASTGTAYSVLIGYDADKAGAGDYGIAIGYTTLANINAVALGKNAYANNSDSVSIGSNAGRNGGVGNNGIAIGGSSSTGASTNASARCPRPLRP